jgi:c-di-AMP phosphodiesterase-like protein
MIMIKFNLAKISSQAIFIILVVLGPKYLDLSLFIDWFNEYIFQVVNDGTLLTSKVPPEVLDVLEENRKPFRFMIEKYEMNYQVHFNKKSEFELKDLTHYFEYYRKPPDYIE